MGSLFPSSRDRAEGPTHPSNRLVAQLNETWRVIDDPLQWILQRRKGNPRKKNSGWQSRSVCRTRGALIRCTREYIGEVDGEALAKVHSLKISEDRAQKRRSPEKPRPYARDRRASRTLMLLIIQVEACRTTEADRRAKIKLVAED